MANSFWENFLVSFPFGILGSFLWLYARRRGFFFLPKTETISLTFWEVLLGFIFRFFSNYLVGAIFTFLGSSFLSKILPLGEKMLSSYFHFFCLILTFFFCFFYFSLSHKVPFQKILQREKSTWSSDIKNAFFFFIIAYSLSSFLAGITKAFLLLFYTSSSVLDQVVIQEIQEQTTTPSAFAFLLIFFNTVLLAPLVEEFLFRGLLQNWLNKWGTKEISILITSLFFAFFHYQKGQQLGNIPVLIATFVLSYFLGYLYERKGSLFAPIFLHAFSNFFTLLLIWIF